MTLTMYDAVEIGNIPSGATAVAGYVDGRYATYNTLKAKFPHASILSIAVFAQDDADCLDIEPGDATPAQAPDWVKRQKSPRPCLYASVSAMDSIVSILAKAGIPRNLVRLWSAHYTGVAHICGPGTCKQMSSDADGTQWTDHANGISLDESLLKDDFFTGGTVAAPSVTYVNATASLPVLQQGCSDKDFPHWSVRRVQAILNDVYGYPCNVDGVYGVTTASAVKLLQGRYGLVKDGVCGEKTWGRIIGG